MNEQSIKENWQGNMSRRINMKEDITISGIGGRFPMSDSTDEFAKNLYDNVDMISEDVNGERWPKDLYGMSSRMGRIRNIDKFDGLFFGYHGIIGDEIDPESRILLETTYEAIVDAGINPQELRGSNTGVYIAYTQIGYSIPYPNDYQSDYKSKHLKATHNGLAKCMYANRISYVFDFKGPSFIVDTACSSSFVALDLAIKDIRLGVVDQAIVGGTQIQLQAFSNNLLQKFNVNATDGMSKVWDENADGFVKSEAVLCILLQKKSKAKRIYATVIHSKLNNDGYKQEGYFFPSKELHQRLMEEVLTESGMDPNDIDYFEAHATGTKIGDSQEAEAIHKTYCKDRTKPLLIGLLKGNIGHGEATSGLASITKTIISFENKMIPANLYPKVMKPSIAKFCPPFELVMKNTPIEPNYCGISNLGAGGVNGHIILKANKKELSPEGHLIANEIPRLINCCGRTQEALDYVFDFIEKNPSKITRDFLALLNDTTKYNQEFKSSKMPFRGSMIIKQKDVNEDGTVSYIYSRKTSVCKLKPIWFFFSGMGTQWNGMAKAMMAIDKFKETIEKCAEVMKRFNINLHDILLCEDDTLKNSTINPFIAITSMQIALFDVLNELEIQPEKIIGHSFGEIACAYADGCLDLKQAMLCSYWRGKSIEECNIPNGKMAAVGLNWEEAVKRCPKNVYVACDNAYDSVTISGLEDEMNVFMEQLKSEGNFVREVRANKPFHSEQLKPVYNVMTNILKKVIPNPKKRSKKWVSTSVPEKNWGEESAKYASAEYFVNNLVKPVLFTAGLSHAPDDAVVIEIAPHNLFASLIKKTLREVDYVGLMKRNDNEHNLETFLSSIGQLYQLGINPAIEKLYPKVEWPVARGTQSISSIMKWDHINSYSVKKFPEFHFKPTLSDMIFEFSLDDFEDEFLADHIIDGKVIFPGTGYLMLAWRRLAAQRGQQWNEVPVVFENVQFRRAVMFEKNKVKLTVRYMEPTGEFIILHGDYVVVFGHIRAANGNELQLQDLLDDYDKLDSIDENIKLSKNEFFRELRTRGYDYGPKFQHVIETKYINFNKSIGKARITNSTNFIAFLDSLLVLTNTTHCIKELPVPLSIESFKCDPLIFYAEVDSHKKLSNEKGENFTGNEKNNHKVEKNLEKNEKKELIIKEQEIQGIQWFYDVPMIHDSEMNATFAKGIEFRNWRVAHLPRKFLSQDLRLEKYEFIPFNEENAIENYNRNGISKYLNVCTAICKQILEKNIFQANKEKLINHLKSVQVDQRKINKMTIDINEDQTLLKALHFIANEKHFHRYNELSDELKSNFDKLEFDISKDIINLVGRNERLIKPMIDTVNESVIPNKELNVLEINMTNGIIGCDILQMQSETFIELIPIQYTIANKNTEKIKEIKDFGDFNIIEWIHYNSDFPENINNNYDLIIHRDSNDMFSIDLNKYIKLASEVLHESGFLLGVFRTKSTLPEIILNDLLENEPLPNETELVERITIFEKIVIENGFKIIMKKTDSMLFTAILFRKINKNLTSLQQTTIEIKIGNYEEWLEPLKQVIKEHKEKDKNENIWLYASDSNINGIIGLIQCLRMESGGEKLRYIFDMDNRLPKKIDFNLNPFKDILEKDLVMNIFKDGKSGSMKHLSIPKDYDKTESTEAYVSVLQKGDLSSLQWFDGRNLMNPLLSLALDEVKQVDVEIYYSALNFRDVMMATGKLGSLDEIQLLTCDIGSEFAGRRCDTGERVYGLSMFYGIANVVKTHEPLLFTIPNHWSMEDAATILTVYMTCWHGLIERGQIKEGESILIHSGAGAVGQAAINICQHYKCKIFTTVSTQKKRDFLKKTFGLTDGQIFNSRTTEFERKVMEATRGQGVDLVLNSLAEDKLLASFRCLGFNGRFIEIGKYDMQLNNPLPMNAFLKNITFHGIVFDKTISLDKEYHLDFINNFKKWMTKAINLGFVKPLDRTVYNVKQVKSAFKYMMAGKHIGKVLIKIRDEESNKYPLKPKPMTIMATTQTWFDSSKVYIIIGGLGGMGLEMVYWMVFRGARKFILTSRSGIKTNSQRYSFRIINELVKIIKSKSQIKVSTLNVIEEQNVKELFYEAESMGQIGGIFQLALVLHDLLIENQSLKIFNEVCKPKVDATINLDKLSRQLNYPLDYFVTFSSIACGRGNRGQSPYGYANSVMERICENRRRDGLHGLAIQWGPIGDVGAVVDIYNDNITKFKHLIMQRVPSWTYALDKFLQCPYPVVASTMRAKNELKSEKVDGNFLKMFWKFIGIDPKKVANNVSLEQIGMESFIALELQRTFERELNTTVTLEDLRQLTIGDLKNYEKGNKDYLKQLFIDFRNAKQNLSKVNFELSNEPVIKLNNIESGKSIYVLPPIESIFESLMPLIKLLPFPVYGLNWTYEMEKLKNIKEIALHYSNLMKILEPNGNYTLMASSFGSVIALRMAYKNEPIKKLIIIESDSIGPIDENDNEDLYEQFMKQLKFFNRNISPLFQRKIFNEVIRFKDKQQKLDKLIELTKRLCSKDKSKDLELIINGVLNKSEMIIEFEKICLEKSKKAMTNQMTQKFAQRKLKKRFKSDVIVIKSDVDLEEKQLQDERFFNDYGINKEDLEGKYHAKYINGSTEDILNSNVDKTAHIISEII